MTMPNSLHENKITNQVRMFQQGCDICW